MRPGLPSNHAANIGGTAALSDDEAQASSGDEEIPFRGKKEEPEDAEEEDDSADGDEGEEEYAPG